MNTKITKGDVIAIAEYGEITHHASANIASDYMTLCGMDCDDPDIGIETVDTTQKTINCIQCFSIWKESQRFDKSNFQNRETRR